MKTKDIQYISPDLFAPKDAWDALSLAAKSEMMKVAVRNGITDLKTIREKYNEFAGGGDTKKSNSPIRYNTTGGAGYVPDMSQTPSHIANKIRNKLYNNISPSEGYSNPFERISHFIKPGMNTRESVQEEEELYYGPRRFNHHPQINDELWATYLNIPKDKRRRYSTNYHLKNSKYRPLGEDGTFVALPLENIPANEHRLTSNYSNGTFVTPVRGLIDATRDLPFGRWYGSGVLGDYGMAQHSIARNVDAKGEYVAYKDTYDLNPWHGDNGIGKIPILSDMGDASFGIGKPVNIYDRIYLDDYYEVPKEYRGGIYLPEIIVKGNKHSDGGSIHIKPENRGKFTALKAGIQPTLEADGLYHLGSRDPETGRILKAPHHPTYLQAINTDARIGYYPTIDKQGVTYTDTWEGNKFGGGGGMKITPRTTGGAGYIPNNYGQGAIDYIRRKLYNNVLPWGYNDIPKRVYNAVIKDKKETDEARDKAIRDDLWATYLQIPKNARHNIEGGKATLTDAIYKPKGAVKGKPTYKFSKLTSPAKYGILAYAGQVPGGLNIEGGDYLPIGKNRVVYPNDINAFSELEGLGQFTVGRGYDKRGEYVSYYDSWDLGDTNSPYKDSSLGIGKPFNIYDRIYLDDYYDVSEPTHSTYLPEVTVYGNKKAEGGPIHIDPSKKGTFTAAATKHGKSVQEFASQVLSHKENYSPAMVKKANFARNASHWKHGLGGNLFSGEEEGSQQMNIFRRPNGEYFYQASPDSEEISVTPLNTLFDNPALWTYTDNNGKLYTPRQAATHTQGSIIEKEDEGPLVEAAKNYLRELQYDINNGVPIGGKYTIPAIAAAAALPVVGEAAAPILANPYVDAGLTSAFAGHGLNHAINEGIDGWGDATITALEIAPLGRLAKPIYKGVIQPGMRLFNSPLTGNWTRIGNREYRLSSNSLGASGIPIESKKVGDYSTGIDLNKMRSIFKDYEKGLTQYKGSKSPSSLEYNYEMPKIDFDNLVKDDFVEYLSQQTGRKIKRVPIKDTKHGDIYNEGFAFVDDEGKELAHIAGRRKGGKNVWVESSYVDPEFRYKGLGKQMYFDLNDHVFSSYGTTLHSDPMQRVGSTGVGMSPSNRLWKSLRDNGMSTVEGEGFNRYDIMVEPSKITTAYRTPAAPQITEKNAASMTPEQWTAAQDAAIARGDMDEAQRLRDLHFKVNAPNTEISNTVYHGTDETFNQFDRNKIGTKTDYGVFGEGFYFSPTIGYARQYGDNIMPMYLNIENPYVGVDAGGILSSKYIPRDPEKAYQSAYEAMLRRGKSAEEASKIANKHKQNAIDWNKKAEEMRSKGYDGIFANTKQMNSNEHQFVAFNPKQIKSADAVTYDNNGVRIPLGLRDNFKINDIRYGLLPFLGLGAVGALYGKQE